MTRKELAEEITLAQLMEKSNRGAEVLIKRTIGDGNEGYYLRITATIDGVPCVMMVTVSDKPSRK